MSYNKFKHLRAFVFDSWFESNKGVYFLVRVYNGGLKVGDYVKQSTDPGKKYEVINLGILIPEKIERNALQTSEVGYVFQNIKNSADANKNLGSTISFYEDKFEDLPGLPIHKPLVYTSIYPEDADQVENLTTAINKLILEDPAVSVQKEASGALGSGFRCGFQGLLHMDVFRQRIKDEFNIGTISNMPTVLYKVRDPSTKKIIDIENVDDALEIYSEWYEPYVKATIITNKEYEADVKGISEERRGKCTVYKEINDIQVLMEFEFPLSEIMTDFHDMLKSLTKGYVSWEYALKDYREAKIRKVVICVAGEPVDALSILVHEKHAHTIGKKLCKKQFAIIPKQLFSTNIQARIGGKIVASEKITARRKDVTAKCYGGDFSRKKKLLDRQKEGKKNMKDIGKVTIPNEKFNQLFKDDDV